MRREEKKEEEARVQKERKEEAIENQIEKGEVVQGAQEETLQLEIQREQDLFLQ